MSNTNEKYINYYRALANCFRDEENRLEVEKVEIEAGKNMTDEFVAMFQALYAIYLDITGDQVTDILDFTYIMNRLIATNIRFFNDAENEEETDETNKEAE